MVIAKLKSKLSTDVHFREMITGSAITFTLKMCGMLLNYVLIYIISNKLGAAGVGYFNLYNQSLIVITMFLGLGLNISVLRFVGQFNNEKDRSKIRLLFMYILQMVLPLSIIGAGILFFGAEVIVNFFKMREEYTNMLKAIGITLPFFSFNQISVEFVRGLKKLRISELIRSVTQPLIIVIGLLLFRNRQSDVLTVIVLFIVGAIFNFLFSGGTILMNTKGFKRVETEEFTRQKMLETSYPMMITSILAALMGALPFFLLEKFSSETAVGIFSVASRIPIIITFALTIVNTIVAPKFAEFFWSDRKEELQRLITQAAKIMLFASLFFSTIILIGSKWLLGFFGNEYREGHLALIILVFGQFINAATGSVGLIMNMSGHQTALRNINLLVFTASVIPGVILIRNYPLVGAAIWVSLTSAIINILSVIYVKRKIHLITFYLPGLIYKSNK
jgi:O-antigen/teichoic acid export membrane protein